MELLTSKTKIDPFIDRRVQDIRQKIMTNTF